MLETLEAEGRLAYQTGRVKELSVVDGDLYADFGNGVKHACDRIIDCAVINRGIKSQDNEVNTPLIARLLGSKIIDNPPHEVKAIDLFPAPEKPVWAIGPLTNEFRNGLGTFRYGYQIVGRKVGEYIERLWTAPKVAPRPINPHYQRVGDDQLKS